MKRKMLVVRSVVAATVVAIAAVSLVAPVQAKHEMRVNLWCIPLKREIPTGTWAIVHFGWFCMTRELREDFLKSIQCTLTIDGETVDCEITYDTVMGYPAVYFDCYWHPRPPGEYYVYLELVFTKDHFDGWYWYLEGTEINGERIILVTPRDLYPQDPPEEQF